MIMTDLSIENKLMILKLKNIYTFFFTNKTYQMCIFFIIELYHYLKLLLLLIKNYYILIQSGRNYDQDMQNN